LAVAHRRDLLEADEQARLAAQGRHHASARHPFGLALGQRGLRGRAALDPRGCAPSPAR
jgi:hypothetical protein